MQRTWGDTNTYVRRVIRKSAEGTNLIGFKIAAQTRCFAQSLKKALHTAASLECDGVQIDARNELLPTELSETGVRQFRKMLDDLNLRVGSIAFPTRRGYANPTDLQRRIEATRAAMQLASKLGARILIGKLGEVPAAEDASAVAALTDAVQTLATLGDRLGIRLVMQSPTPANELLTFIQSLPEGSLMPRPPSRQIDCARGITSGICGTNWAVYRTCSRHRWRLRFINPKCR